MAELYCAEMPMTCVEGPMAEEDPTLLCDNRVLDNLLQMQPYSMPAQNYFKHIQKEVQPYMRKIVSRWMLDVCEDQGCEDQVFTVSLNFFDRFLCACEVQKTQLQLLGAVCLLLASKLRQCRPFSVDLLSRYTDYSVSVDELTRWEVLLVCKLGWDLSPVTATDFVDQLLKRIHPRSIGEEPSVRRHATTYIALAVTEPELVMIEPSAIAVSAIAAALRGLHVPEWTAVLSSLAGVVHLDAHALLPVIQQIESVWESEMANLPESIQTQQQQQQQQQLQPSTPTNKHPSNMDFFDGNETPTDVCDINF